MKQQINIVYSTDEKYYKICLTSVISLLESNVKVEHLKIYIIDNNITREAKKEILNIIEKYHREIEFISCNEICADLEKNNNFPVSAYARLFIQNYIKEDKVIYIDCDTSIRKELTELWNIELEENWIGGVQDPLPNYLKEAIGMNEQDRYINSGVLIINLKKWRIINFKEKVIDYINKHNKNVVHHDQGLINGICKGKIKYIHPKFNVMPEVIMMTEKQLKKLYKTQNFYKEQELEEARKDPYIIHYICKFYNRPWFKECTHPYKEDFQKYYNKILKCKLKNNPLNIKIKLRKFTFEHFPFFVYSILENILDHKRKKKVINTIGGN